MPGHVTLETATLQEREGNDILLLVRRIGA